MTLSQKQRVFAKLIGILLQKIYATPGYEVTFGDAWRSKRDAEEKGFPRSLHCDRLAIDLNLWKDGVWKVFTEEYEEFGLFWESLSDPQGNWKCCWGGRFNDGNHFSIEHNGVR